MQRAGSFTGFCREKTHFDKVTPAPEQGEEEADDGEQEGEGPAWGEQGTEIGGSPAEGNGADFSDVTKAIPQEIMAQDGLQESKKRLESELETVKAVSETKVKDMEVAGLLGEAAADEAEAGNLEKVRSLANESIELLVKTQRDWRVKWRKPICA